MKKVVLSVAIMSFALLANAQVLKKDLLKDYKPGDQLEKADSYRFLEWGVFH